MQLIFELGQIQKMPPEQRTDYLRKVKSSDPTRYQQLRELLSQLISCLSCPP